MHDLMHDLMHDEENALAIYGCIEACIHRATAVCLICTRECCRVQLYLYGSSAAALSHHPHLSYLSLTTSARRERDRQKILRNLLNLHMKTENRT